MKKVEKLSQSELNIQEALRQAAITEGYGLLEKVNKLDKFRPSVKSNARMERVIEETLKRRKRVINRRIGILLVAALLAASMLSVSANWTEIYHAWINVMNQTAGFGPDISVDLAIDWSKYHLPAYLPKGYEFQGGKTVQGGVISYYQSATGDVLSLRECAPKSGCTQDGDYNETFSEVTVNGKQALLSLGSNNVLIWEDGSLFILEGTLDEIELLQVAESISKIEEEAK